MKDDTLKTDRHLSVLIVDDAKNILATLKVTLMDMGHGVVTAESVQKAVEALKKERFDLILTDFRLGASTGTDLLREAKSIQPDTIVVVMTAYSSIENAVEVTKEGAYDYLPKPFTNAQLAHLLDRAGALLALKRENETLKRRLRGPGYFAGFTSPAMERLERFIKQAAPTDETVLVTGESGTGKTELARLIHAESRRADGPFVTVYCSTLAESVLESELFGHVKGAFTGAVTDKVGKLELARGGTLFLDEIGDLTLSAQMRLLRFLQEKVIERVGGTELIAVDARIIAATNRDLQDLVANGKFREDLYYRLNTLECTLVPLRHRKEDIPVLIQRFLEEASARHGKKSVPAISEKVMRRLLAYGWPGNIRELKNTIERAVILAQGPEIDESTLPPAVLDSASQRPPEKESRTLEELEREHIARVLKTEENLEKAAEVLGITPVTLWRKRKQYGLP